MADGRSKLHLLRRPAVVIPGIMAAVVLTVSWPVILKQRTAADRTWAISHLKGLSFYLIEFDSHYGRFPDRSTIAPVKNATGTDIKLGETTSNDLFRQLIATGSKSEKIFWARTSAGYPKPDDDIRGPRALEKGECSFAYVAGLSSKSDPNAPVAMAPLVPGTTAFDPKPYGGKAAVLRCDGFVRLESLDASGHVIVGGMDLFDPHQPYWEGKVPDIKWPE